MAALQEVFNDKAVLELHRLHDRQKRQKAIAAQEKRQAKAEEKRAAQQQISASGRLLRR